ncbi:MAG: hypothetical protein WC007_03565 [Pelobacteraceae bacterium]
MRVAVPAYVLMIIVFSATVTVAGDPKARATYGLSPHTETADCSVCHVASSETLRSWFAFGSTKKQLKGDLNDICQRCHGSNFGHATGKRTTVNHAGLPLASDDTVTCATTCHDMHIRSKDQKQQFYHLRLPFDSLCISCHDK